MPQQSHDLSGEGGEVDAVHCVDGGAGGGAEGLTEVGHLETVEISIMQSL